MTSQFILCADDFAISAGVSRAIATLAEAGRISAASAIVTRPRWSEDAATLRRLRDHIAVGLHVNLTLGAPLGRMKRLAPAGKFLGLSRLLALVGSRRVLEAEIQAEITRQIAAFQDAIGAQPDSIDGHQHVHALPFLRDALLRAAAQSSIVPSSTLLRDPSDSLRRIVRRPRAALKAALVSRLVAGLSRAARNQGYIVNVGFSGYSNFAASASAVSADFSSAQLNLGPLHILMSHPGHSDAELTQLDPHRRRRDLEFDFLTRDDAFRASVWRPERQGGRINWPSQLANEDLQ